MKLLLLLIVFTSSASTHSSDYLFNDDIVGQLKASSEEPPFLTAVLSPNGPLFYPNTKQIRALPSHPHSRYKLPDFSERSLALQGFLGMLLNSRDYERMLLATVPVGTRIEDQKYNFKAMIVSDSNWESVFELLAETERRRAEEEKEAEVRGKEEEEAKNKSTKKPIPRSEARPRRSLRRNLAIESYENIPLLGKVEYPTAAIIQELQRCALEETADVFAATDFKILDPAGKYTGFALYRVTCVPVVDQTFVAVGLQRILFETTMETEGNEEAEIRQEEMILYADALLRQRVYDEYYFPYLRELKSYPTLAPMSRQRAAERAPFTWSPPTAMPARTSVSPDDLAVDLTDNEDEYDDDVDTSRWVRSKSVQESEYEDGKSLPSSVVGTNRVSNSNEDERKRRLWKRNHNRAKRASSRTTNGRQARSNIMEHYKAKLDELKKQTTNGNCRLEAHDIVIVLDESGSIGHSDFQLAKRFIANLTQALRIGRGDYNSRLGLVKFSDAASVTFKLNTHLSNSDVYNAIMNLPYASGGTNIASGINAAIDEVFTTDAGDRAWIPNMMIVMTDGQDSSNVEGAHVRAKQKHINATAIGIGSGVNSAQLAKVTGDEKQVFHVDDFANLNNDFIKKLCAPLANELQDFDFIEPEQVDNFDEVPIQPMEMEDGSFVMIN